MAKWITTEVQKSIEDSFKKHKVKATVQITEPGGDCDTDNIFIQTKSGNLHVCGFTPRKMFSNEDSRSEADVEMAELSDGQDSRGGLNSTAQIMARAYAATKEVLVKAGFEVVGSCKENW